MPTITAIEEKRGIMEISADGCVFIRIRKNHYERYPLEIGEEIDTEDYLNRIASVQFPDAYEAALTSLDFSARTAREISNALRRKGFVAPVIEAVIEKLTDNHLIDDRLYAQRVAECQSKKPVGVYAVKRKLRAKGISEEDAEAAMEAFDEDQQREAAFETARRLYRKYESLPRREARGKLSQALARRGFSWEVIESAIESIIE
ncbi:MAG: RecX family transcriptional regulator [Clostridia bacterium]|nr:RecX family transcriptional regulator [Clostridia bacterium]